MDFLRHLVAHHGVLYLHYDRYLNMADTDPGMYEYIPTNMTMLKYWRNRSAGIAMYMRSGNVYNNLIRWMVICSLDLNCLQPSHPKAMLVCPTSDINTTTWLHCHRYDQSLAGLLSGNWCWINDPEPILPYEIMNITSIEDGRRAAGTNEMFCQL